MQGRSPSRLQISAATGVGWSCACQRCTVQFTCLEGAATATQRDSLGVACRVARTPGPHTLASSGLLRPLSRCGITALLNVGRRCR